jgi:hypothetical protein
MPALGGVVMKNLSALATPLHCGISAALRQAALAAPHGRRDQCMPGNPYRANTLATPVIHSKIIFECGKKFDWQHRDLAASVTRSTLAR